MHKPKFHQKCFPTFFFHKAPVFMYYGSCIIYDVQTESVQCAGVLVQVNRLFHINGNENNLLSIYNSKWSACMQCAIESDVFRHVRGQQSLSVRWRPLLDRAAHAQTAAPPRPQPRRASLQSGNTTR